MGITGLIGFTKNKENQPSAIKKEHISAFRGQYAAVDVYSWLHKSVYTCAQDLYMKKDTTRYVDFCISKAKLLQSNGVKPILVFDGGRMPFKVVEAKRQEDRAKAKKRVKHLLSLGKLNEAFPEMVKAIDITHEMASKVIKAARALGIDCIVAPFEADAQLAFLEKIGYASVIITEDSDLMVYGCKKIFFKMDNTGYGELYNQKLLENAMKCKSGVRVKTFSFEKFQYAAILSGCDYLKSLPGIGLVKAWNFMNITDNPNIRQFLTKIPRYLNMPNLKVDNDYITGFIMADMAFKYQLVFDPRIGKRIPLNHVSDIHDTDYQLFLSKFPIWNSENDIQIALGNLDSSLRVYDNYNPQNLLRSGLFKKMSSEDYQKTVDNRSPLKEIKMDSKINPQKKVLSDFNKEPQSDSEEEDLLGMYKKPFKKRTFENLSNLSDSENAMQIKSEPDLSEMEQFDDKLEVKMNADILEIKQYEINEETHNIKKEIKSKKYKFVKVTNKVGYCSRYFSESDYKQSCSKSMTPVVPKCVDKAPKIISDLERELSDVSECDESDDASLKIDTDVSSMEPEGDNTDYTDNTSADTGSDVYLKKRKNQFESEEDDTKSGSAQNDVKIPRKIMKMHLDESVSSDRIIELQDPSSGTSQLVSVRRTRPYSDTSCDETLSDQEITEHSNQPSACIIQIYDSDSSDQPVSVSSNSSAASQQFYTKTTEKTIHQANVLVQNNEIVNADMYIVETNNLQNNYNEEESMVDVEVVHSGSTSTSKTHEEMPESDCESSLSDGHSEYAESDDYKPLHIDESSNAMAESDNTSDDTESLVADTRKRRVPYETDEDNDKSGSTDIDVNIPRKIMKMHIGDSSRSERIIELQDPSLGTSRMVTVRKTRPYSDDEAASDSEIPIKKAKIASEIDEIDEDNRGGEVQLHTPHG